MKRVRFFLLVFSLAAVQLVTGQDVYKTPSGSKYHLANCGTVRNSSEKITVLRAHELGLQPCKICKPSQLEAGKKLPMLPVPSGEGAATRCQGVTAKGEQCRRTTRIGNGYCYQHKPK